MTDLPLHTLHVGLSDTGLRLLSAMALDPRFSPAGLMDVAPGRLAEARTATGLSEEDCFDDLAEALLASDADAVVVAVPAGLRADMIIQVLAADQHVLVAHPFTLSLEDARQCAVISVNRGARLMFVNRELPLAENLAQFHAYVAEGVEPPTSARRMLTTLL